MPDTNDTILDSRRNKAAASFIALTVAIASGAAYLVWNPDHSHVKAVWKVPQKHAPNFCYFSVARAPSEVWDTLGLKVPEGTPALALVKSPFYEDPACLPGAKVMVDAKTVDAEPVKLQASAEATWAALVATAKAAKPEVEPTEPPKEDPIDPKAEPEAPVEQIDACATRLMVLPGGIEAGADEWVEPCGPESVFEAWLVGHPDAPWRCHCTDPKGTAHPMPCGCWTANCGIPAACCEDEFLDKDGQPVECSVEGKCGGSKPCVDPNLVCIGRKCVKPAPVDEPVGLDAGTPAKPGAVKLEPVGDVKPNEDVKAVGLEELVP